MFVSEHSRSLGRLRTKALTSVGEFGIVTVPRRGAVTEAVGGHRRRIRPAKDSPQGARLRRKTAKDRVCDREAVVLRAQETAVFAFGLGLTTCALVCTGTLIASHKDLDRAAVAILRARGNIGRVAQLGERWLCKPEVAGSKPVSSIWFEVRRRKLRETQRAPSNLKRVGVRPRPEYSLD